MKKPKFTRATFYFEDTDDDRTVYVVSFYQQKDKTMQEVVIHKNNGMPIYDEVVMAVANKTNATELLIRAIN
jgi:hypothetical protein